MIATASVSASISEQLGESAEDEEARGGTIISFVGLVPESQAFCRTKLLDGVLQFASLGLRALIGRPLQSTASWCCDILHPTLLVSQLLWWRCCVSASAIVVQDNLRFMTCDCTTETTIHDDHCCCKSFPRPFCSNACVAAKQQSYSVCKRTCRLLYDPLNFEQLVTALWGVERLGVTVFHNNKMSTSCFWLHERIYRVT